MPPSEPRDLARSLVELGAALQSRSPANSWYLGWLLMVGASYSLAKARPLLSRALSDLYHEAETLLQAIGRDEPFDDPTFSTWSLGYLLNSAELRIQSALHRILQEYAGRDENAFPLVQAILEGCANCRHVDSIGPAATTVLEGFLHKAPTGVPGSALRDVWRRANALKHDPEHNPSELFEFQRRWDDASNALHELTSVFRGLAGHRGEIAAA